MLTTENCLVSDIVPHWGDLLGFLYLHCCMITISIIFHEELLRFVAAYSIHDIHVISLGDIFDWLESKLFEFLISYLVFELG